MLSGDNGILTKAADAKNKNTEGAEKEQLQLATIASLGTDGRLDIETLKNNISKDATGSTHDNASSFPLTVTYTETGNVYEIDGEGNVEKSVPGPIVSHTISPEGGTNNSEVTITISATPQTGTTVSKITKPDGTSVANSTSTTYSVTENGTYTFTVEGSDGGKTTYSVEITNSKEPNLIGDYVEYDVSYTDMYSDTDSTTEGNQAYTFTKADGWRIVDQGTKNADGTYSNVKIVSTGVPAILYYHYKTNAGRTNNGWWGTDDDVSSLYSSDSNISTILEKGYNYDNGGYPNYYVAAGLALYKNFKLIKMPTGTSTTANKAYSTNLSDTDGDGEITGNDFLIRTVASEVHNLTLAELNKAREYTDLTSIISTSSKDGDTGLFYLRNLSSENSSYGYSSNIWPNYWLASPRTSYRDYVWYVNSNSNLNDSNNFSRGVRPVVSLTSKIQKVSDGHWKIVP